MSAVAISPRRRRDVIDALRRGTVPRQGLDVLAVGLARFESTVDEELDAVARGGAGAKAVRGEYGAGKTFFSRWLVERARRANFATAEIQISETETPLHRLETVYRRVVENLATPTTATGALRDVVDGWFHVLDRDLADEAGATVTAEAVLELAQRRLAVIAKEAPAFAAVLRRYRSARTDGDDALADGLLAWLGGQPHVAASVKRAAGIRGELDHFGALGFLQGLLTVLRDSDYAGLVVVLDEVETLAAHALRRAGEVAQRAAAAARRDRRRPLSRAVRRPDRDAGLLRRPAGRAAPRPARPAAGDRLPHRPALRQPPGPADPARRVRP